MRPPLPLQLGPWLPDAPALNNPGITTALNVVPITKMSYGPISMPTVYSNALGARCQGSAAFIDVSGNVFVFAGTATDLYLMKFGAATFSNVSKSSGAYSTPADGQWIFTYFNGSVIATNFEDPPQVFALT